MLFHLQEAHKKINVPHFEVKKYDLNLSRLQLGSLKKEDDEKEGEGEEPIRRSDHNSKLGNPRKITAREERGIKN